MAVEVKLKIGEATITMTRKSEFHVVEVEVSKFQSFHEGGPRDGMATIKFTLDDKDREALVRGLEILS